MKKLFIPLATALLLFFCSFSIIAQSQKALDNRAVVTIEEWTDYWQPVICDGVQIDYLTGSVLQHKVYHYKDGELVKQETHTYGEVISTGGEVFKLNEKDKEFVTEGSVVWHFNLVGNQGSHYIGTMYWDYINDIFIVDKAICPGN